MQQQIINKIKEGIELLTPQVHSIPEAHWLYRRAAGKWSKKEELGHLVDSALNNLKRFSEISAGEVMHTISSYPQDGLVIANDYQEMNIDQLVQLWELLNLQICRVIERMPENLLGNKILLPDGTGQTVHWLLEDYAVHLHHHLKVITEMPVEAE